MNWFIVGIPKKLYSNNPFILIMMMAEEKKFDEAKLKFEDIINVEVELEKREKMIEIALGDIDDSWTKYKTGNDNITVNYKTFADSDIGIIRSTTTLKGDYFKNWYKSQECGYEDVITKLRESKEENFTEINILKMVDLDHAIIYMSAKSAFAVLKPRDALFIKSRFKKTNVSFKGNKYKTVMGNMSYSISENHPFYVAVKKDHVRANMILNGYVLYQPEGFDEDTFKVCKIFQLDPNGSIPVWVANQFSPKEGMKIQRFEPWNVEMQKFMKTREENSWEKQHKAMFAQHPRLMCQETDGLDSSGSSIAEKKEFVNEISEEMKLLSKEYTFKKHTFRSRIICLDDEFDDIIFQLPKDNPGLMQHIKSVIQEGEANKKDVKIIVATIVKNDEETDIVLGAKID